MGELRKGQQKGHFYGLLRHRNSPTGEQIPEGRPTDQIAKDPPFRPSNLPCLLVLMNVLHIYILPSVALQWFRVTAVYF